MDMLWFAGIMDMFLLISFLVFLLFDYLTLFY